jgi:hypothetical protein
MIPTVRLSPVAAILSTALLSWQAFSAPPALEFQNQKDAKPFSRSSIMTSDGFN